AVGRDVNILSRLELLCKDVGRPLLMTDTFAVEVAEPVIEIGHFELRGLRRHQAVYALCQEGEQPCRAKPSLARAGCNTGASRKSYPHIAMGQSGKKWLGDYRSARLDCS